MVEVAQHQRADVFRLLLGISSRLACEICPMRAGALCPRAPNLTCRWPRPAWSTMESTSSTGRPSRNSSRSTRAVATGNARPPLSAVSPAAQRMSHLIVIVRSRILPLAHACRKQTVLFALSLASVGFSCYLLYERARTACPRQAALGVLLAPQRFVCACRHAFNRTNRAALARQHRPLCCWSLRSHTP